jgi:hypothetical protein
MARGRVLLSLWVTTCTAILPIIGVVWVADFVDVGVSWSTPADEAGTLPVLALFCLAWAVHRTRSLSREARGLGIPVTVDALRDTQTYTLTGVPVARVRAELAVAKKASMVAEAAEGDPVRFRWRPFRLAPRVFAEGSVTFDEVSGEVRVALWAGDGLSDWFRLFRGAVFIALCQTARCLTPGEAPGGYEGAGEPV